MRARGLSILLFFGLVFIQTNVWASSYDKLADQTYRKLDNSLTLHITPSTYPLEWKTPLRLVFSIIKNRFYFPVTKSDIGHVTAEINCTLNNQNERFFIGQTVSGKGFFKDKLLDGYGLSLLNRPGQYERFPLVTVPGKLNDKEKTYKEINRLISISHFGAISFEIENSSCLSVLSFAKEYERKTIETKLAGNIYGFGADPLNFEGAGCAPMAEALLLKANLDSYQQKFIREVYVPENLIGNPLRGNKVGIISLLLASHDMSKKNERVLPFKFPDPQLMYDFLQIDHSGQKMQRHLFPNSKSKLLMIRL